MTRTSDFEKGKTLLHEGRSAKALPYLRKAYEEDSSNPERKSYYGLVNALELGQINQAIELCLEAVRRDAGNADLRFNLAYVFLKAGRKAEGVRALEEGIQLNPEHRAIAVLRQKLGVRRAPVIRHLSRGNALNKYLGLLAHRVTQLQRRLPSR